MCYSIRKITFGCKLTWCKWYEREWKDWLINVEMQDKEVKLCVKVKGVADGESTADILSAWHTGSHRHTPMCSPYASLLTITGLLCSATSTAEYLYRWVPKLKIPKGKRKMFWRRAKHILTGARAKGPCSIVGAEGKWPARVNLSLLAGIHLGDESNSSPGRRWQLIYPALSPHLQHVAINTSF